MAEGPKGAESECRVQCVAGEVDSRSEAAVHILSGQERGDGLAGLRAEVADGGQGRVATGAEVETLRIGLPEPENALLPVRSRGARTPKRSDRGRRVPHARARRVRPAAVEILLGQEPPQSAAQVGKGGAGRGGGGGQRRVAPGHALGEGEEVGSERAADPLDGFEIGGARLRPGRRQEDESGSELLLRMKGAGLARTHGSDELVDGEGLGDGRDRLALLIDPMSIDGGVAEERDRRHLASSQEAHEIAVQRRVLRLHPRRGEETLAPVYPIGSVHERAVRVEEVAPMVVVGSQEVVGDLPAIEEASLGQPLVRELVGEDIEGLEETEVPRG